MDLPQIVILALIQGFTEFLPISSSAHLILVPNLFGWPDQGLAFDIAAHVGTLSAVLWFFRHELAALIRAWLGSLTGRGLSIEARLAWGVIIGTVPVGLAGLLFKDQVEHLLRSPWVIAGASILFGLVLWWADVSGRRQRDERTLRWSDVLIIGMAQAVALIPGTSRSGITMTAGLALGLTREASARFSFLLSIPVIALAGALETLDLVQQPQAVHGSELLLGALLSGLSAYLCIYALLKLLGRIGMLPFVIYRVLLGVVLVLVLS
ncbi:MAG TPA: undecaprenyl-diphosphate phosphatase [Candidatus Competibacteraceae bacterium]|nr:undecaprenyl-diphosphate phosphatase [Candidatus Competibacteraceae bacterium]